jgi:hypothetical protein
MKSTIPTSLTLSLWFVLYLCSSSTSTTSLFVVEARKAKAVSPNLHTLDYSVFPRRTEEEAAVLEWGHSAIISALDASVAKFGPQTSQAALLEVECMPILASPLHGEVITPPQSDDGSETETRRPTLQKLQNSEEVHGNIVVMTNNGNLSGVQMAKVAKMSGAAALLVVNVDEVRPDDIHRLDILEGEEEDAKDIDIPVVMVSLNSANVLTTATVEPHMEASDVVNHGMPERVRLYAGGDRPFFEDVEPSQPTLYLIHNLLTSAEADAMVQAAESKFSPAHEQGGKVDILQLNTQPELFPGVERAMLWQGTFASPGQKAVEERIEQVTGFPSVHFSEWVVERLEPGAHWQAHFDTHPYLTPMATITVFLNNEGGPVVYPSGRMPFKILPRKGMAIVHHNTDEKHRLDYSTIHALLPKAGGGEGEGTAAPAYIARKYVLVDPISNVRRVALPAFAFVFGGKLPSIVSTLHDMLNDKFGYEDGNKYFDKLCIFVPALILLLIVQYLVGHIRRYIENTTTATTINATMKKDANAMTKDKGGDKKSVSSASSSADGPSKKQQTAPKKTKKGKKE